LDYYLSKANKFNPTIKELQNQFLINDLQNTLDNAQSSAFQISLSSNYLFAPYFNNTDGMVTINPDVNAIGYDIGITNGGLYSAQLNIDKNIFNGAVTDAFKYQQNINEQVINNNINLLTREITKQVTDQYLQTYLFYKLYEITNEIGTYLNEQVDIIAELSKNGIVKHSEYLLLSIEKENMNMTSNEYYSDFKTNLFQLNTLCGIKDSIVTAIDPIKLKINEQTNQKELLKKFELYSLALLSQQEIFELKYLPQVSFFFNTGLNAVELNNIQRKFGLSTGINFSLPIFDGNQSSLTRQQNKIEIENIKNVKNNYETILFNQKLNTVNNLKTLRNNINNIKKQLESYQTIIKISENDLHNGQLSIIEYITILKNYTELQKNKTISEINYQTEVNNYNYWN
jgi:outer membrane protein TolC